MASNHVPSDQVPLQGQSIYTDPSSFNYFPNNVERYGTPSWEAQLHQNTTLTTNATNQNWQGAYPQQTFNSHGQTYAGQTQAFRTASPYQYGQFNQHGSTGTFGHAGAVDPSLGLNGLRQQQSPYPMPVRNATPSNQSGTVTPQALQQLQNARASASPFQVPKSTAEQFTQQPTQQTLKPVRNPVYEIPKGKKSGGLYVLDVTALAKATNSTPLNKLVTLGTEPIALPTNRTALPLYTARQSIKELKRIGADNKKLLAKLSSSKSSLSRAIKFSSKNNAGSPGSLKREVSDSSDYTDSSEDDSEYSDSDDEEESPLPALRPDDDPHKAVCYDVIKASWFPRRSPLNSEKIKSSMRDLWEVLNTIQKRWRADSKAVAEAEEAKKIGELPTLKSRVTSQRDLLQSALKAALEHAHPDVLYHLGQVKPFLYLCYQFLANRFKAKDFDGPLPSAIYEILAKCGTLTMELVEETKVSKALVSMKKQANDKNKAFIQQIVDAAAAGSKKAKANSPPTAETAEAKGAKRPASEPAVRTTGEGHKKAKPAEGSSVAVKKETAIGVPKPTAAAAIAAAAKRPGEKPIGAPAPVRARVNPTMNKSSSIFASLNAATKKPAATATAPMATKSTVQSKTAAVAAKDKKPASATAKPAAFSFASTMAALTKPKEPEAAPTKTEKDVPNETPEQRAKRLRKEARRHLRVTFRPDASLVAIKYFSHDPEEELGHDENFTRDAGDLGGEGHMFKQHKELEEDDDDEDDETEYRPWTEPSQVDFSIVDTEERKRNYAPFGGGENVPTCPEKEANEQREKDILMVFYTSSADIPPSPHEPPEQTEENTTTVTMFGTPPDKCLNRAPKPAAPAAPAVPANLDFAGLESIVAQLAAQNQPAAAAPVSAPAQPTYAPPAPVPAPAPTLDLAALLASFGSQPPPLPAQTSAPAPPQLPALPALPAGVPPPPPGAPPAELAAFLAAMQAQGGALPPMPPGFPPIAFPGAPFPFPPQADASAYQQDYQQSNGGTKRPRDDGNNNNSQGGQGKKHKAVGKPHKVQPCKFFQKGTCNKGDNCTYIHDLNM
ncbi:hypothetical protein E8E12_009424 [Didymella heteroderae]|uniref:C3H1-type domain-containing protein n=1 Tax=Didymella heteroderae TaxID=1769908 RepID=A0A9P4WXG2_9PLEO|nr:hypothetical protein E8E12_009424 [Didymella heteroderae]